MLRAPSLAVLTALVCACPAQSTPAAPAGPIQPLPVEGPPPPPPPPQQQYCSIDRPGPTIHLAQGLIGVVCFWKGDFMPSPDPPSGSILPVARTVEIHAATRDADTVKVPGTMFLSAVKTPLIATTTSDADGWFSVALPPGTYSVFVREPQGLYANGWNDAGIITSVDVVAGEVVRAQFNVDYAATH